MVVYSTGSTAFCSCRRCFIFIWTSLFFDIERKSVRGKKKQKVHVITMGCSKNVVDSEKLMAQLRLNDIELTPTLEEADIAIINTCGFIEAAREESIDMIIENVRRKGKGRLKKVYAMGCLTQRYPVELAPEIPEVG